MSYILAALKKADQEREIGAVPNLATPSEVTPPQTRSYRWPWIIVALLSINIVLVIWLLKDRDIGSAPAPVAAEVQPAQQAGLVNDQPVQVIQPASEDVSVTAQIAEEPARADKQPALPVGELVVLPAPAYLQQSNLSLPQEDGPEIQATAATTAQDHSQLQSWYELSQEFRNGLDLPRLDIHVYSDEPAKRFIMVELKKYREGQTLASGLKLEEILPDGMVMSYRGERFRVDK
jgi:general secretion pathway protein B